MQDDNGEAIFSSHAAVLAANRMDKSLKTFMTFPMHAELEE
ncbi:hypothetical protein AB4124_11550 [Paenibacillus sp. 2KB_20]